MLQGHVPGRRNLDAVENVHAPLCLSLIAAPIRCMMAFKYGPPENIAMSDEYVINLSTSTAPLLATQWNTASNADRKELLKAVVNGMLQSDLVEQIVFEYRAEDAVLSSLAGTDRPHPATYNGLCYLTFGELAQKVGKVVQAGFQVKASEFFTSFVNAVIVHIDGLVDTALPSSVAQSDKLVLGFSSFAIGTSTLKKASGDSATDAPLHIEIICQA